MALENPSLSVDKLKAKLKKKYPNHNFDIKAELDSTCKMGGRCPGNRAIYYDNDGNYFCGAQVKLMDPNSMEKSTRECGAFLVDLTIKRAEQKRRHNAQPLS